MEILLCASEAYPLIKTGGLAEVCGSLPAALARLGHDVRLALPAYPAALEGAGALHEVSRLRLRASDPPVRVLRGTLPGSRTGLYLIDAPAYFNRPGNPYLQPDGRDWPDNAARFALFARACAALGLGTADSNWRPRLLHCNDWQTGLVPALLSRQSPRPATLFSIHNLAYQGLFPAATFQALELPDALWSIDGLEFHNQLSFIKGGIANADHIATVSPSYAREIRDEAFGYGLDGLLRHRSAHLSGILNGVDVERWNPASDPLIARRYDVHRLQHKLFNKFTLQRDHALPVNSQPLLLSYVGRLVDQKGVDMLLEIVDQLVRHPIQLVVLGNGERRLEEQLLAAAHRYPRQIAVTIGYDERLAHRIAAGSDALLMPSRYEPCGLSQMYAQLYGTVPIARRTGGLRDTIVDYNQTTLAARTATGLCFDDDSPQALLATCLGALRLYRDHRVDWWKLVIAGMQQDFSWTRGAARYSALYAALVRGETPHADTVPTQRHADGAPEPLRRAGQPLH